MNVAIVFGGGVGTRFSKSGTPKQFVELYGKPIIVYTLEHFDRNSQIDEIVIPCVLGWEEHLSDVIKQFNIKKPCHIVGGGETTHESRLVALTYIERNLPDTEIVVLHDAVRPLVSQDNITQVIRGAKEHGAAVSYVKTSETPARTDNFQELSDVYMRSSHVIIKAPQAFDFRQVLKAHLDGRELPPDVLIDGCTLMVHFGKKIHMVLTEHDNIKITTAKDYFVFKALFDERHYEMIFGIH